MMFHASTRSYLVVPSLQLPSSGKRPAVDALHPETSPG